MPTGPKTSRLAAATIAPPGPTILSTRANGLGAVGQRGDGLGATDREGAVHPSETHGGQHMGVARAVGRRHPRAITSATPATLAGIAVISTVDG